MKQLAAVSLLALGLLMTHPAPAAADLTAFLGEATTPATRSAKGVSVGIGLVIVGFEFEYAKIAEDEREAAPSLTTGMGNIVIMTPTSKLQLYGTTGGGVFHEQLREFTTTNVATNVGGGVKIALAGPIRLRLDYRVFKLNGTPIVDRVHRFYGGLSLSF
jgi:hypothetical protein